MKGLPSRVVPRFFAPVQLPLGAEIDLPERVARHCAVLRLRRGDAGYPWRGACLRDIEADAGTRVASCHRARSVRIERRPDGRYLAEIYRAWRLQHSADRE